MGIWETVDAFDTLYFKKLENKEALDKITEMLSRGQALESAVKVTVNDELYESLRNCDVRTIP